MSEKINKLRSKLEEATKRRTKLNETINKIQKQIKEEEEKEFRSVLEEMNLSFTDAVTLLKKKDPHSNVSSAVSNSLEGQESGKEEVKRYETI